MSSTFRVSDHTQERGLCRGCPPGARNLEGHLRIQPQVPQVYIKNKNKNPKSFYFFVVVAHSNDYRSWEVDINK